MKRWGNLLAAALVAGAIPVTAMAQANHEEQEHEHETPIAMDKLPAAVHDTIMKQAAGAPILDVVEEHEGGKLVYEAHVRRDGQLIGIEVDPSGKFLRNEVEKTGEKEEQQPRQQQQQQQPQHQQSPDE